MPSVALLGTDAAPVFAAALDRLGWTGVAVAGERAEWVSSETGTPALGVEELIESATADVVVVGTPGAVRVDHTIALLARGRNVVVQPGFGVEGAEQLAAADAESPGTAAIESMFAFAPVTQEWFRRLRAIGNATHLSGRTAIQLGVDRSQWDWPLVAVAVMSAGLAGWGRPVGADRSARSLDVRFERGISHLHIDWHHQIPDAAPWNLQAADEANALRIEILPRPLLEHNGDEVAVAGGGDHTVAYGAAPMMHSFWDDVTNGRRPVLDPVFALTIERLLAGNSPPV